MWPMSDEVKRNDLLAYEPLTRVSGPAMTWSMHSIGFTELGDFDKAQQLFRRSYETYVRPPFNVSCLISFIVLFFDSFYFNIIGMDGRSIKYWCS
jgi:hypothetical protein